VIFGCGYVGTAVAREAQAKGIRVEALTRNPDRAAALVELGRAAVWPISRRIPGTSASRRARSSCQLRQFGGGGTAEYRRSYVGGCNRF